MKILHLNYSHSVSASIKNYSPQMTKQVELSLLMHNYYVA